MQTWRIWINIFWRLYLIVCIFYTCIINSNWMKNKDIRSMIVWIFFLLFCGKGERQTKMKWREKVFKDLQLILDWNRPDMALSMIFHRDDWGKIKVLLQTNHCLNVGLMSFINKLGTRWIMDKMHLWNDLMNKA